MADEWEQRLGRWQAELDLFARLDDTTWVPLSRAEAETGVSRSTLRSWYRNGEIRSRLVDGPNGPQRLVPLDAVVDRAALSPRIQRRAERELSLEAQVALLRHRVDQLELQLGALTAKHGLESPR
jgi:transposase